MQTAAIINYNNIQYENPKIHCLICVDALINSCVSLKPVTYTSNTFFLTGYSKPILFQHLAFH